MKTPLPAPFRNYVASLYTLHRNISTRTIRRFLILRWTLWSDGVAGNEIPGYDTPPLSTKAGIPAGWSEKAIAACKPDMTIRTAGRRFLPLLTSH